MKIYETQEYRGYGKSYFWYEYHLEGSKVVKYKCRQEKIFDGKESEWSEGKTEVDSWEVDDPELPDWLHKYL